MNSRFLFPSLLLGFAALTLFGLYLYSSSSPYSIVYFMRDTASLGGLQPIAGFLSNMGILFWCISVSVNFYSAYLLSFIAPQHTTERAFLLTSGLLSLYLLLDDLFQLHESSHLIFPTHGEKIIFLTLAIFSASYMIVFRKLIFKTSYVWLISAFSFLAASILVDSILSLNLSDELLHWIEDGFKWLGIICWAGYYLSTSTQFIKQAIKKLAEVKRSPRRV